MPKAIWNGEIIAESDATVIVEGSHYFPADSIRKEFLADSPQHTTCHWKGVASYYDITVDGASNPGAAWYYPQPSPQAEEIKDHVAFWRGVRVES